MDYALTNPEFNFTFNGKMYRVRKANLDKAIQYQMKVKELSAIKDGSGDGKIVAFAIFLVLKDYEKENPGFTEQYVLDNTPGDIDFIECMTTLGFINPNKVQLAKTIQETLQKNLQ
jgi:hypothetical protein